MWRVSEIVPVMSRVTFVRVYCGYIDVDAFCETLFFHEPHAKLAMLNKQVLRALKKKSIEFIRYTRL